MAGREEILSLCVAEHIDDEISGEVAWKIVADYMTPRRGNPYFEAVASADDPPLRYKNPSIGEVSVLNWSQTKKTPSGDMDVRLASQVEVFEVIAPLEFNSIYIEDEDDVRRVLREGFAIYFLVKTAFKAGQTNLVIQIPSKTGLQKGLLIRDKDKFFIQNSGRYAKEFWEAKIEPIPENSSRFIEKMDVVLLEENKEIHYNYRGSAKGSKSRVFLSESPKVERAFLPYTPEEFAPIFLKRAVDNARKLCTLTSGRKLNKSDMPDILAFLMDALNDRDNTCKLLNIEDEAVATRVLAGLKEMIPSIKEKISQDSQFDVGMRKMLFNDPDIEKLCIEEGKAVWMQQADAEREEKEKALFAIDQKISETQEVKGKLEQEVEGLSQSIEDMKRALAEKKAAVQSVSYGLREAVSEYREDLSRLIRDTACGSMGPMPFVIPGEDYPCEMLPTDEDGKFKDGTMITAMQKAFTNNLSRYIDDRSANNLAQFIGLSLRGGYHLAVSGDGAKAVADSISLALEGRSAGVVACADAGCEFAAIRSSIMGMSEKVILVEGLLSCEPDQKVLAVARHCPGKIFVFSIDDEFNQDKISSSVYHRIAMVGKLSGLGDGNSLKRLMRLPEMPELPNSASATIWSVRVPDGVTGYMVRQKELMHIA